VRRGFRLGLLLAALGAAQPLGSAVTDFFVLLPKAEGEKPTVRVLDDKDGINTYDLGEAFDETGADGTTYHDHLSWLWWRRGPQVSYVVTKGGQPDGGGAPQFTFKRVGPDGREAWRKGPVSYHPAGVSMDCGRVLCLRPQGEGDLQTATGLIVLDAKGDSVYALAKAGLGPHMVISPSGGKIAYVDGLSLVIRDLDAGTETRDDLADVRRLTGTHDPRWLSGLKDDGSVVYVVQMMDAMSAGGGQYASGETLKKTFNHGDK
jgi:hypothetical protein